MLQIVEQREYIDGFLKFVGSFAITEQVTIAEMHLVKSNLEILLDRINELERNTVIEPMIKDKPKEEKVWVPAGFEKEQEFTIGDPDKNPLYRVTVSG